MEDETGEMMKTLWTILLAALTASSLHAQGVDQFESFRRAASLHLEPLLTYVFANDSVLAEIDSLPENGVLRFDTDGDGVIDALAWREGRTRVAALDEDRDLLPGDTRPDRDNDCYLADIGGDGVLDRVVDYVDPDRDGVAERQDLYEITNGPLGASGLGVTIFMDLDGDNRFLALSDYTYHANRDQWRSDFDGNACLVAGERNDSTGRWVSSMENPFCFYDDDGDGLSDEALRLEGTDLLLKSLRWSFDADDDATAENPHDYDFSLTATGNVRAPQALADSVVLRDGAAIRFVSWKGARDLARWGLWESILLVWDEEDRNVAPFCETPDRERWEGVIADGYAGFPQIGGPSCGRTNKRYEVDRDASGRLGLYWTPVDDRIHLLGAEQGELQIQIPEEPPIRRAVRYGDANGNGFFDTWTYSTENAVRGERTVETRDESPRMIPTDGPAIQRLWRKLLPAARDRSRWDLEPFERSKPLSGLSPIRRAWLSARDRNEPFFVRAQKSIEAERFLYDLSLWEAGGGFLTLGSRSAKPSAVLRIACVDTSDAPTGITREDRPRERRRPYSGTDPDSSLTNARASAHARLLDLSVVPEKVTARPGLLTLVEMVRGDERTAGQFEDRNGDSEPDDIYISPECAGGIAAPEPPTVLEIDPGSPLPRLELVRVDPYLASGIGFESSAIAYKTAQGRLEVFAKRGSGTLILRRASGGPHGGIAWEPGSSGGKSGAEYGGLYIARPDGTWRPFFGAEACREERVLVPGPLRAVVRTSLVSGESAATRTWTLGGGDRAILESLRFDAPSQDSLRVAFALPTSTGKGGILEGIDGVWSYGPSGSGSDSIGFAGAILDGRPAGPAIGIPGGLQFLAHGEEPILLGWVGGGTACGDSTAGQWRRRAAALLLERRGRDVLCAPE